MEPLVFALLLGYTLSSNAHRPLLCAPGLALVVGTFVVGVDSILEDQPIICRLNVMY
jgi:hypothetical protein